VIGALVILWSLADEYAEANGRLPGYTKEDLDRETELPGFCDALPPDWFEIKDGVIYLPNYQQHNGDTAKRRAENTARQQRLRARQNLSRNLSRGSRDKSATREEKRREDNTSCSEPAKPASEPQLCDRVILTFPTAGTPKEWHLTEAKVQEWAEAYPGVDVQAECRKALQWCRDNPKRKKTADGMTRFLNTWLSKAQNQGAGVGRQDPKNNQPTEAERMAKTLRDREQAQREEEAAVASGGGQVFSELRGKGGAQ
jgi:hypothetical protein